MLTTDAFIIAQLLDAGADVRAVTTRYGGIQRRWLCDGACARGSREGIHLGAGRCQHNRDERASGATALHLAARRGNIDALVLLLHYGANPNAIGENGWCVAHPVANGPCGGPYARLSVTVCLPAAGLVLGLDVEGMPPGPRCTKPSHTARPGASSGC